VWAARVQGSADPEDAWGVRRVRAHFRTRTGVIELCMVAVVTGLYILMRKLGEPPPGGPRPPAPPRQP
jgi:hypothetical protein